MKNEKIRITKREDGKWETETGMIIGEEIGNLEQLIIIEDEAGEQRVAVHGVIVNEKFTPTCTGNFPFCGERCSLIGKGNCKYNAKIVESGGYYLM